MVPNTQSSGYKFPALPDNGSKTKTKKAYLTGFVNAITGSSMSAVEKVAWLKYAAASPGGPPPPPGAGGPPPDAGGMDPVAGPGPGFVPEDGAVGGAGPQVDPAMIQQILASLPGNSPEEKLQAAVEMLAQQGGGGAPGVEDAGSGVEPGAPDQMTDGGDGGGAPGGGGGQVDPALIQHLMSQMGGAGGPPPGGPQPPPGGPPQG